MAGPAAIAGARAEAGADTLVVAGVDEAGLGPLLGPLAIGWSVLSVPASEPNPWKCLKSAVAKGRATRSRLMVADSKQVFSRTPLGRKRLESTVLSFAALLEQDGPPRAAEGFLFRALRPEPALLRAHPWSARLPELPCESERATIELRSAVLARALRTCGAAVLDAGVRVVPEGELNASYAATGNKALSVWAKFLEVLRHLWDGQRRSAPRVVVDMLGGRRRYGPLLARSFPEARVGLRFEKLCHSAYALEARDGSGAMELEFRARAEQASFPVALASCFAKYARELAMHGFNAYFAELDPALRATAGYRQDARRWLGEARTALERSGLPRELLVRER